MSKRKRNKKYYNDTDDGISDSDHDSESYYIDADDYNKKLDDVKQSRRNRDTNIEASLQTSNNAYTILESIKMKNINALIPNLATIITLSKETSDYNTISEKLTNELVLAIVNNVSEFVYINKYLEKNENLLKRTIDENTDNKINLFKTEKHIRELWALANQLHTIDSSISIETILDGIQKKFNTLHNLMTEYTTLNIILKENEQKSENLEKRLKLSQNKESKLETELQSLQNTLQTLNETVNSLKDSKRERCNSPRHESCDTQLLQRSKDLVKLHGDVLNDRVQIKKLQKKNDENEIIIRDKNQELERTYKKITKLEQELQTIRDTRKLMERTLNDTRSSLEDSEYKTERIAWRIAKIIETLQRSDSSGFFSQYLLNFTNIMLNVDKSDNEIDILLDDVREINNIINENPELRATIDNYLTTRKYVMPEHSSVYEEHKQKMYMIPAALTYIENDDNDYYTSTDNEFTNNKTQYVYNTIEHNKLGTDSEYANDGMEYAYTTTKHYKPGTDSEYANDGMDDLINPYDTGILENSNEYIDENDMTY